MKSILILLLSLSTIYTSILAQSVPVSNHTSDQVIQGPCYIFATIAALESNALQNGGSNVNFNEWQFFSTCVMGSLSGSATVMIPKSVEHVATHGAFSGSHSSPTVYNCPNPNDPLVPCIADFNCSENLTWCVNNKMYLSTPEAYCPDNENNLFEFMFNTGAEYSLSPANDGSYWKKINLSGYNTTSKSNEIKNLLNSNIGVIANFVNWRGAGAHSLFIYDYSGSNWRYKDSWPGDAGVRLGNLDLSKLNEIYYISGEVEPVNTQSCSKSISGNSTVSNDTYYNLLGSGSANNINWSVSGNLMIVSGQGSSTLKVRPNTCSNTTGSVSVTYNGSCNSTKNVTIKGASPKPSQIIVASPNWNYAGETCPNTTLELNAVTNTNHNNLYYDWSISGATLDSGQGTSTVFVTTPSSSSYLNFRVRTKRGSCPYSQWKTIYGYSSENNGCSSGGGYRIVSNNSKELDFEGFFISNPSVNKVNVNVYSITGVQLFKSNLEKSNPNLKLGNINLPDFIIIHLYDNSTGISTSFKHWIGKS